MRLGLERVLTLSFGQDGNEINYLGAGWSGDEPGSRWMIGMSSVLWLEHPGAGRPLILELDVGIVPVPSAAPPQRLMLGARTAGIAQVVVSRDGPIAFHIPAEVVAGPGPVRLVFIHPDFKRPVDLGLGADDRELSFSVRGLRLYRVLDRPAAATAARLPLDRMIARFESLGDNCEFGLVQRALDAEPLGLFRFSFIRSLSLLRGLRSGFAGLDGTNALSISPQGANREYMVTEPVLGMRYHTFLHENEIDLVTVARKQAKRLRFLRRKFLQDAELGRKIFVIKQSPEPLTAEDMLPVYTALNELGSNWLLWMVPADDAHPAGTVQTLMPGLLRGNMDRFAPMDNAPDLSRGCWTAVCEAAWRVAGGALGE